jgi:hypothetical protein
MAWAKNGTPSTLGSAGDVMTISDLTASKFNQFMCHVIGSGAMSLGGTFNNSTGSEYARRREENGDADYTEVSQTVMSLGLGGGGIDKLCITYAVKISGEEGLVISDVVGQNVAGAGSAPTRENNFCKWVPSTLTDTIDRFDFDNGAAGDYLISSNLSALGSEGVESLNVQDGAVFYDTDLNKSYVLYNNAWTEL